MKFAVLLLWWMVGTAVIWGQMAEASLSGTVKDDSGASLPGAAVSVMNIETGAERRLMSDENGRYSAPSLPIGRYLVTPSKEGFNSQVKTGIDLQVGQTTVV